jgi:glutaredoxin-like protein
MAPIFRPDEANRVRELLDALDRPVDLLVALGPEETPLPGSRDIDFGEETQRVVEGLAALSERVTFRVEQEPPGFERYPAIAVLPNGEDVGLRYYGLPWGYELAALVGAVLEAGKTESSLSTEALERLAALDRDLTIDVFVTPTCPHCPPAVLHAYRAALASPRIRASAIEATEFPSLADSMDVWSVPRIVVNGVPHWDGTVPERVFLDRILAPAFE